MPLLCAFLFLFESFVTVRVNHLDSISGENARGESISLLGGPGSKQPSEATDGIVKPLVCKGSLSADRSLTNQRFASSETIVGSAVARNLPYYLIAALLAATATSKLWMLLTDPFADIRVGIPTEILWLSVAFEFLLAYGNIRIRDRSVLAFVNTVVFGSFAIIASIRRLMGYGSCGCSGNLEIPAWIFIVIDLGIVAWFAAGRHGQEQLWSGLRELSQCWRGWSPAVWGRCVGLGLFGGAILAIQLPTAAPLRAMAMGEPPIMAIASVEGDLILNRESKGLVEIRNRSLRPAKIVGMNRSCRCFEMSENPFSQIITANERISLPLVIKPEKTGPLHQRVVLFLDHPDQFRVNIDVAGIVKGED